MVELRLPGAQERFAEAGLGSLQRPDARARDGSRVGLRSREVLDDLAKQAGWKTETVSLTCRSRSSPKPRPMTPETILRELRQSDRRILLETTDWQDCVRRVAVRKPSRRESGSFGLKLPERSSANRPL